MALADMQVYDTLIRERTIELLGQDLQKFNAGSAGTITLDMAVWMGNYTRASFYASIASAQRRVDRYNAIAAAPTTDLVEREHVGVKVAGGFGPVVFEPSQLTWLASSPEEAINVIAQGFADALLADQLNTIIGCAVAAIENQGATLVNDVTGTTGEAGTLSQVVLNGSHAKFGDMSQMLRADVMSGAAYHELLRKGLENGERLFESSNVMVQSILGKVFVITDAPALTDNTNGYYKVLSLVSDGAVVDGASDIITNLDPSNGQTRIQTTWQADYSFGVKLKGYAWDIANGGPSPDDTDLFTGSNWDLVMDSVKHTAGTLAVANIVATVAP